MRKTRKNIFLTVLLAAALLCTGIYTLIFVLGADKVPPKISVEGGILQVPASYTREDLMQGVSARDARDGDVTAGIVVERVANITAEHMAEVTYAAFDAAGNVTKATRTVLLTDYRPPRLMQREALAFQQSDAINVLKAMQAQDVLDGDISHYIKGTLVSEGDLGKIGVHSVEFRVTNSLGDTQKLTLPVEVYEAGVYHASAELSEYLVYIPKGAEFKGESYLRRLTAGRSRYSLTEPADNVELQINGKAVSKPKTPAHRISITMESGVDTAVPGVYSVTYRITLDNNYSAYTRLNVVVEG